MTMNNEWLSYIWQHYNIVAALLALALIAAITIVGKKIVFSVPALGKMRALNKEKDKPKWKQDKYPPVVRATQRVGLYCNITFFLVLLPFCITLAPQPIWEMLLDVFIILMVYDFVYYLSHRFWFHGQGPMRKIHAVHHQARNPTYLDAHYVHPLETFVGLALYMGSIVVLAALLGPFHIATIVLTYLIFTQINQINHVYLDLPYFPFKTLNWIVEKHHVHHENMHKGNYATITLFYDKLFGTLD
jgi:sterol desaturase/sphingolipid hydroxylase (fatty acid hydroxylase superfamily)